jgi:4-carboxymuconolactone decarboxylase
MDDKTRYEQGMAIRRSVLGEAWVDKANAGVNDFNRDFQDFITRTAWGDIWSRPGLDRKTRSVIVLSVTIALRYWDEFRLHVRAAFNNGMTKEEMKEIILQCSIYASVPAANHAYKEALEVFAAMDREAG